MERSFGKGLVDPAQRLIKETWFVPRFFLSVGFFPFSSPLAASNLLLWHALIRAASSLLPIVPCIWHIHLSY
jgi:hypothetical protein